MQSEISIDERNDDIRYDPIIRRDLSFFGGDITEYYMDMDRRARMYILYCNELKQEKDDNSNSVGKQTRLFD